MSRLIFPIWLALAIGILMAMSSDLGSERLATMSAGVWIGMIIRAIVWLFLVRREIRVQGVEYKSAGSPEAQWDEEGLTSSLCIAAGILIAFAAGSFLGLVH